MPRLNRSEMMLIVIPETAKCMKITRGFMDFQARYPELCEGANVSGMNEKFGHQKLSLATLSQPCLSASTQGPTKILPFVFLGSQQDVMDQETLKKYGIDYVLNMSTNCPKPDFLQDEHFLRIPVHDSYSEKLLPYFEQAFQFLDKVKEASGVALIHCLAGISRSPTLAIAYVMRYLQMSQEEAYRYVKEKRPSISPNFNFLGQLLEYEKDLNSQSRFEEKKLQLLQPLSPSVSAPMTPSTGLTCKPAFNMVPTTTNTSNVEVSQEEPFSSPAAKIGKRTSQCSMNLTFDNSSPANETNVFGKRQMEQERNLGTLASIRKSCLEFGAFSVLLKPVQEDLPSPSTEMSRLSFDQKDAGQTGQKPDTPFPFVPPGGLFPNTIGGGECFAKPSSFAAVESATANFHSQVVQSNTSSAIAIKPVCSTNVVVPLDRTPSVTNPMFAGCDYQVVPGSLERMDDEKASQSSSADSVYGLAGSNCPSFTSFSGSQTDSSSANTTTSSNINVPSKHSSSNLSRIVTFSSTNPKVWDVSLAQPYPSTSYSGALTSVENPMFTGTICKQSSAKKLYRLGATSRSVTKSSKKFQEKKISLPSSYRGDAAAICGKRAHDEHQSLEYHSSFVAGDINSPTASSPIGKQQQQTKKCQLSSMSQKFSDFLQKRLSWPHVPPYIPQRSVAAASKTSLKQTESDSKNTPSKSKSESAMLYALSNKRSSSCPQSSAGLEFLDVEKLSERSSLFQDSLAISAHHRDPERESMGSSSSLEIAVS